VAKIRGFILKHNQAQKVNDIRYSVSFFFIKIIYRVLFFVHIVKFSFWFSWWWWRRTPILSTLCNITIIIYFPLISSLLQMWQTSSAQEFKQQIDLWMNSMPRGKIANWAIRSYMYMNEIIIILMKIMII